MRKGIVIILAVAIIGALGIYGKSQSSSAKTPITDTSVQSAATTTPTTPSNTTSSAQTAAAAYKDGTFTGKAVETAYGTVQIQTIISGGRITDVKFVAMPDDRGHTQEVTNESAPLLKQETLSKQSAHIDFVTGATQTSEGYQQSLQSALDRAT